MTFALEQGRFVFGQVNAEATYTGSGTYRVEDDLLYQDWDNGEQFVMRWHLDGDSLVLERDDSLGAVPTPYIIKPWTRQA